MTPMIQYVAAILFALAVLHTFFTKFFQHLAHNDTKHAGLWHLLGEVEVVFGLWSFVLLLFIGFMSSEKQAIAYLEDQNFTEALFVFVILTIAATSPILSFVSSLVGKINAILPVPAMMGRYFLCLSFIPLLGSFITEPAAMTLSALLLRDVYFNQAVSNRFKYLSLAVLLVNISIGGVLTPYAAPPVLMVAEKWGWDLHFMSSVFGWKAAVAVFINAVLVSVMFKNELAKIPAMEARDANTPSMPVLLIVVHLLFLLATVWFSHHPVVFIGLFLFFLGFTHAYPEHQSKLMLKEGLLVGFFLGGLVVLGGLQQWWLQPLISQMQAGTLFFGAIGLTALTDNAALTYLGSLVDGISDTAKYALVAGAVTGGGLTVIANAPNPAGFSILKECFDEQSISPLNVFLAALTPTAIAAACFYFL
ncbi:MFS family permease [Oxalobacteraceae bacterium GrIS 2.11]